MILTETLKVTQVLLANLVALPEGRPFEFAGSYLGDVMGQIGAHRIL
jgi:hypothetical protein